MKFDRSAGESPIDQLKVASRPRDRIDEPLRTTSTTRYTHGWHEKVPNATYSYIVGPAVAEERLTVPNTDAA